MSEWFYNDLAALSPMPLDFVRLLWDLYDGGNSPLGISAEAIHHTLNLRGDGAYCAV